MDLEERLIKSYLENLTYKREKNIALLNVCRAAAHHLGMGLDTFMKSVYELEKASCDRWLIKVWLDDNKYSYTEADLDEIVIQYWSNYEDSKNTWDNIKAGYLAFQKSKNASVSCSHSQIKSNHSESGEYHKNCSSTTPTYNAGIPSSCPVGTIDTKVTNHCNGCKYHKRYCYDANTGLCIERSGFHNEVDDEGY